MLIELIGVIEVVIAVMVFVVVLHAVLVLSVVLNGPCTVSQGFFIPVVNGTTTVGAPQPVPEVHVASM